VLLDGRLLEIFSQRLDVGRDVQRLDVFDRAELVAVAPGEESSRRVEVGRAGVAVADGRGEEFQKAPGRVLAGTTTAADTAAGTLVGKPDAGTVSGRLSSGSVTGGWSSV
jgi:hypothetical protein